jgi:hypothetical protein
MVYPAHSTKAEDIRRIPQHALHFGTGRSILSSICIKLSDIKMMMIIMCSPEIIFYF